MSMRIFRPVRPASPWDVRVRAVIVQAQRWRPAIEDGFLHHVPDHLLLEVLVHLFHSRSSLPWTRISRTCCGPNSWSRHAEWRRRRRGCVRPCAERTRSSPRPRTRAPPSPRKIWAPSSSSSFSSSSSPASCCWTGTRSPPARAPSPRWPASGGRTPHPERQRDPRPSCGTTGSSTSSKAIPVCRLVPSCGSISNNGAGRIAAGAEPSSSPVSIS